MRRILPYIFGFRALLVIVVMVAGIAGFNLRADAQEVTPDETTETTSAPAPVDPVPSDSDGAGDDGAPTPGDEADDPEAGPTLGPPVPGSSETAGSLTDPAYVRVVLAPRQLDAVSDASVAATWALGVLCFCAIVTTVCIAKGSR